MELIYLYIYLIFNDEKIFLPIPFCFLSFGMNAQTLYDEAAQELANIMCRCINNTNSSIDDVMADETGEKWLECETCIEASGNAVESKYASLQADKNYSEQNFFVYMIEKEGCELAHTLMQMSLTEPATKEAGEH
jgi:hypothetical protein